MSRYLVTGGAGFIGSHIVSALLDRGGDVRVLDNFSTGYRKNLHPFSDQVEVIEADLLDEPAVTKAATGVDVVFHQAALASVPRSVKNPTATHQACATGTLNLLTAAQRCGVRRVIYAGSSSAYGNQPFMSKRESDPASPLSPYAAAKLAGELYCRTFYTTYGLETVVLRYFNVFGPRQDPGSQYSAVIPRFITAMLNQRQPVIYGDGTQSRDFTYVDNVVAGNLAAADSPTAAGGVFNIACGGSRSLLDIVSSINDALGTKIAPVFESARASDVHSSLADISLARHVLGYNPEVAFDEGLRRSIHFYRSTLNRIAAPLARCR